MRITSIIDATVPAGYPARERAHHEIRVTELACVVLLGPPVAARRR